MEKILSSQLLPNNAIFVPSNNTFFILEIKYQGTDGSVDEKLQTCDLEFIYILSERFEELKYKDALDCIQSVNCQYYIGGIKDLPLNKIGLPV